MKIQYYFGMLLFSVFASDAYSSYIDTNLVEQIKPNPITRSKPTTFPYTKYASVSFLKDDTSLDFKPKTLDVKTQCATLGYVIPISKCTAPMQPSYLCSSETSMAGVEGANQYTSGCCNSYLYTADSRESCGNNSAALNDTCYWGGKKKYRCSCDRSRYPYSSISGEGCGSNGSPNVNNMCQAPDANGNTISYYTSCCPSTYKECDSSKHLVGKGNSCRIKDNNNNIITKYEFCECSSSYDTQCPTIMIDASDICTDAHGTFTRDNNCESDCTQTVETNIDSYLFGSVWHCLYKKDGADVKPGEGTICQGTNRITGQDDKKYYDNCETQGYTKEEDDCDSKKAMIRCPNNLTKVWCLDGKYCTGYEVGTNTACNPITSKVNICSASDIKKGVRCSYQDSSCNKCWQDGIYNSHLTGCVPTESGDLVERGYGGKCCNLGYKLENGTCIPNVCDRNDFPYEDEPGDYAGEVETCYEGKPSSNEVYVYYGYKKCNDDVSQGDLWMRDSDNPGMRKCVCIKQDASRNWYLKYDTSIYFDQNYGSPAGFSQSDYGEDISCTDAEGSYYGYQSCYIGSVYNGAGICTSYGSPKYTTCTPYHQSYGVGKQHFQDILATVKIKKNGAYTADSFHSMSWKSRPISSRKPNKANVYCINYNTHCKDPNTGAALGTDAVCALTKNWSTNKICKNGYEEECTSCYPTVNLLQDKNGNIIKNSDGLYDVHGQFTVRSDCYNNGTAIEFGFEVCPDNNNGTTGVYKGGTASNGNYGSCFKYCDINNLSGCAFGDIVQNGGTNWGIVYGKKGGKIYIAGLIAANYVQYDTAVQKVADFAGTHVRSGWNWHIPTSAEIGGDVMDEASTWQLNGSYRLAGYSNILTTAWTSTAVNASTMYTRNCCSSTNGVSKTDSRYAVPVVVVAY